MHVVLTKVAPDDLKHMVMVLHGGAEHTIYVPQLREFLHDWWQVLVIQACSQPI